MADNDWMKNPIISAWVAEVRAKGGQAILTGYPYPPDKGGPTAIWPDLTVPLGKRYELAPIAVRLAVGYERWQDGNAVAAGTAVEKAEQVLESTGLDKGVTGVLGKVLGIPRSVLIAGVIIGGLLLGYSVLVNVGAVPPLRRWGK